MNFEALVRVIDMGEEYASGTGSHSLRVAEYSMEIAKRAGKSPEEQIEIYYMALLHDVGKIAIPDEIINKPGKLTEKEYEVIKQHTVIGFNILKNILDRCGIEKGARSHHERYDGFGYPDGLKQEDIPEAARIIGVADAYDAMNSERSYRKALPWKVIREELYKGIGTQFDPYFTKIMIKLMEERNETKISGKTQTL